MASKLKEADIPGASLEGRAPEALKIAELKFWLRCRGANGLSKLKTKERLRATVCHVLMLAAIYVAHTSML